MYKYVFYKFILYIRLCISIIFIIQQQIYIFDLKCLLFQFFIFQSTENGSMSNFKYIVNIYFILSCGYYMKMIEIF